MIRPWSARSNPIGSANGMRRSMQPRAAAMWTCSNAVCAPMERLPRCGLRARAYGTPRSHRCGLWVATTFAPPKSGAPFGPGVRRLAHAPRLPSSPRRRRTPRTGAQPRRSPVADAVRWPAAPSPSQAPRRVHLHRPGTDVDSKLKNHRNIRMVEFRQGKSFFPKTFSRRLIGKHAGGKHFEGNIPLQLFIVCTIDNSHAASTDLLH